MLFLASCDADSAMAPPQERAKQPTYIKSRAATRVRDDSKAYRRKDCMTMIASSYGRRYCVEYSVEESRQGVALRGKANADLRRGGSSGADHGAKAHSCGRSPHLRLVLVRVLRTE